MYADSRNDKEGSDAVTVKTKAEIGRSHQQVWFIFSGTTSQWNGMGRDLLEINVFSESINRCTEALNGYEINVRNMLLRSDDDTYNDQINAYVGLTAIQVGLVDVLTAAGVEPDGILGQSAGDIACGYADGCLSLEQAMQVTYWRGRCIGEADLPRGAMASVGLTWRSCLEQCPPGVYPSGHYGATKVTISGTEQEVLHFTQSLQKKQIYAMEVECGNLPLHTHFMLEACPIFLKNVVEIIPEPKLRSKRWISSNNSDRLEKGTDKYDRLFARCSAEYLASNMCGPVMFYNALKKVPENAITVEICPHGLLQGVLKRTLSPACARLVLSDRREKHGIICLYKALDHISNSGINLAPDVWSEIQSLYMESVKWKIKNEGVMQTASDVVINK